MQIELVAYNPPNQNSGIGRYYREIFQHLKDRVDIRMAFQRFPPLSDRFTILRNLPLGVLDHQPGNIVHFTQIMGCGQMLWNPVHPAIATVHDLGVYVCNEDAQLFNKIDRYILSLHIEGLKQIDRYLVNSNYTKLSLIEKLGISESKINFVQLGVDTEHFRPISNAREIIKQKYDFNFSPCTFYLIYVGSELPRKNVTLLLKSIRILLNKGYSIELFKIGMAGGDKWREKTLKQIHELDIGSKVHFINIVPEEDLPLFYNAVNGWLWKPWHVRLPSLHLKWHKYQWKLR
jgi:glycosyltransferase involved in cell wall biosynthesis